MWLAAIVAGLAIGGCSTPQSLNVFAVDSISGHPVAGVQVEHVGKKGSNMAGVTDDAGRLEGIKVERGDQLSFARSEYEPLRVLIDFSEALPMQPSPPPAGDKAAKKADVPVSDADAFPFASDHTVTILLRPK
jgi:hypothetical protein